MEANELGPTQEEQGQEMSIAEMRKALDGGESAPAAAEPTTDDNDTQPASQGQGASPDAADQQHEDSGPSQEQGESKQQDEDKDKPKFEPKPKDEHDAVQKRINKAIWEKHEAERKAEAARREAEELRARLEGRTNQAPGQPATAPAADKPATAQFDEPEPQPVELAEDDYDTLADLLKAQREADRKYLREHSEWLLRKQQAEMRAMHAQEAARQQEAEAAKGWQERLTRVAAENPAVLEAANGPAGQFLTRAGQAQYVMRSEFGPEIVLYVQEHAEETLKVAQTGDPLEVARYIARIEGMLAARKASAPAPTPNAVQPITSTTPPLPEPIRPAGGRSTPNTGIDLNDAKVPLATWKREFRRRLEGA